MNLNGLQRDGSFLCISKTCPISVPLLYSKTGLNKGIPIYIIFALNCGCSLETPRRDASNLYPQSMF